MHGGDIYTNGLLKGKRLLDFSSNINPKGIPESFRKNIYEALDNAGVYPDINYTMLKTYILDYLKLNDKWFYNLQKHKESEITLNNMSVHKEFILNGDNLLLGNGAAEVIDLVISCFKSICIVVPSFIEYEENASKWNLDISYSFLNEDMTYNYEDIYTHIKDKEALIIGNPNNPNGNIIELEKFMPIINYCEENNKTIIIDEAFIEFTGKRGFSLLNLCNKYNCIFIIRALTKFFALPGVRLGYGITKNNSILKEAYSKQNPWNVNCFAETAAKYVLSDEKYISSSLLYIEEERSIFIQQLKKIDVFEKTYESYANFILCKLKNIKAEEISKLLLEKGIIIRNCGNYRGLDNSYVRVAVKSRENNELLIEVLKALEV